MRRIREIAYWDRPLSQPDEIERLSEVAYELFQWHKINHARYSSCTKDPNHYDDKALLFLARKEHALAEREISSHIASHPSESEAYMFRANLLAEIKRFDLALSDVEMAFRHESLPSGKKRAIAMMASIYREQDLSSDEADRLSEERISAITSSAEALRYEIIHEGAWLGHLEYGRCSESPYKESDLWFICVRRIAAIPHEDSTFLVTERYARPYVMHKFGVDIERWSEVANKSFAGSWCTRYQRLWQDVPVLEHKLRDGTRVKYGYCRRQPETPGRHLWFVAFKRPIQSCVIVDECFANPASIDRMGSDLLKWWLIFWNDLDERDVQWDELQTGTLAGGLVRQNTTFALDSPALPFTLAEAEQRIATYESVLPKVIKEYNSNIEEWNRLNPRVRKARICGWAEQHGLHVFPY
jgi:hypothetical protein